VTQLDNDYPAAHTVVIKGVKIYQNGENKEYSDHEIVQMIGRAVSHTFFLFLFEDSHAFNRDVPNSVHSTRSPSRSHTDQYRH
jgi:hypothetical protein